MPSWWDRFGEEWARLGLHDDPSQAQADAGFAFIGQAPPTVEFFNSLFQFNDNKDNWLYGQIANVIRSEGMIPNPENLMQLLDAITKKLKILLTGPTIFYVDAVNGNDSTGTGEQGNPWRTVNHGIQWILTYTEPANNTVWLQLAPGDYEAFQNITTWNGAICVRGDPLNPRTRTIRNPNGQCVGCHYGALLLVEGVAFEAVGVDQDYETSGSALIAAGGGVILYSDVAFGPCSAHHMWSDRSGANHSWGAGINYTIYGGAQVHLLGGWSGVSTNVRANVTIQNNPNFGLAFAHATCGGGVQSWLSNYNGTFQGRRAYCEANGVVNTGGVHPDNFYPGTIESYFSGASVPPDGRGGGGIWV